MWSLLVQTAGASVDGVHLLELRVWPTCATGDSCADLLPEAATVSAVMEFPFGVL